MIHQQNISDTTIHTVGGNPLLHGAVSGNALSPLPCELISRYKELLRLGDINPYSKNKFEWAVELKNKITELQKIK